MFPCPAPGTLVLRREHLRSRLLGCTVTELCKGPAQIGDRTRHLTGILVDDRRPGLQALPAVKDEDPFFFVDVPLPRTVRRAEQPENSFFSLTSSVTIGGRLACRADTRLQPAMAVHSNTSATAHAYFADASVETRLKTCKHSRRHDLRESHRLPFPWTSQAPSCRSWSSRHKKNAAQVKEKARRRGGATQLSVFSHHASH